MTVEKPEKNLSQDEVLESDDLLSESAEVIHEPRVMYIYFHIQRGETMSAFEIIKYHVSNFLGEEFESDLHSIGHEGTSIVYKVYAPPKDSDSDIQVRFFEGLKRIMSKCKPYSPCLTRKAVEKSSYGE